MSTDRDLHGGGPGALVPAKLIGLTLGKAQLKRFLGEGSMGLVYQGEHGTLKKTVAVKVLKEQAGWDPTWRERFAREARSAARFDHPNSVQILDYGEDGPGGLTYIVMEYIEGRSLADVLTVHGPMPVDRLARIMIQVLGALAAAHERGVIHRDIKSSNIMIFPARSDDGELIERAKVCDFGVAKMVRVAGTVGEESRLTNTGTYVGTPAYMSPEQASADPIDARSDLYSCGVVMYEMLSARLPYEAENHIAMIAKHLADEPRPLADAVPGVDRRMESIVHWALEKRRELRCPTAREMRRALKEFLSAVEKSGVTVPPLSTEVNLQIPDADEDETVPMPASFGTVAGPTKVTTRDFPATLPGDETEPPT